MKIYVAIIEDRHTDVNVEVFTRPEPAIAFAKERAIEIARGEEIVEEPISSWLYDAICGVEGDAVRVEEQEMNE